MVFICGRMKRGMFGGVVVVEPLYVVFFCVCLKEICVWVCVCGDRSRWDLRLGGGLYFIYLWCLWPRPVPKRGSHGDLSVPQVCVCGLFCWNGD